MVKAEEMRSSESPRGRFLLVDGHSMIFAWEELRQLHEQRMALAREALCQRLQAYQDVSGERVSKNRCEIRLSESAIYHQFS